MLLMTESSRSAVYYAAYTLSVKDPMARQAISMAKAYCSDSAREVGNLGIQCHGGIGFTWEHNLHLYYNVTRCRYAEMYRELGIPELGAILSCNRDAALIEGFNPLVQLTRTQTLLGGASHCDFRYRAVTGPEPEPRATPPS